MVDILLSDIGIRGNKNLVRRKAAKIQAVDKCSTFELLQISVVFLPHLDMQNLDRIKAGLGG